MKKNRLFWILFSVFQIQAQVGINTTTPNAQLEIKSSNQINPANTDGILIPKVDAFPVTNPTVDQDGMLVFLTTNVGANLKGFYFWDNTNSVWKAIAGDKGWSLLGNAGTDENTNFIGTTDNVNLVFKRNNETSGLISDFNTSFGYNTFLTINPIGSVLGVRNAAFGSNTLKSITSGRDNTAVGFNSLNSLTTSQGNTAVGSGSLMLTTTGQANVAIGNSSMGTNLINSNNTAVGYLTLFNSKADNNTAIGYVSMYENTTGNQNVAVGSNTLYSNTIGSQNTALGYEALNKNKTGSYNVANGYQSLFNSVSGQGNNAFGNRALYNNMAGNYNTEIGNAALYNNIADNNTALGNEALFNNLEGTLNTANGYRSLYKNTYGFYNTAIGHESLYENLTGYGNTAVGVNSLYKNTTGSYNTASGYGAMSLNTTGTSNTGIGNRALGSNTTGDNNTALGCVVLLQNTSGGSNTSIGNLSLFGNTTGSFNTATGMYASYYNKTGQQNVANGYQALLLNNSGSSNNAYGAASIYSCTTGAGNGGYGEKANPTTTTGWNNIGVGFHALGQLNGDFNRVYGNEIGYDNIAFGLVAGDRIGNNCNQSTFIGPFANVIINDTNVSNSTALGNGALVFQNNMMRLGNSAVTRIETQVGLTVVSDGRYKYNVKEEVKGLEFIKKLRPVVYQYDTEKMDKEWMNVEFDTMVKHNPQLLKDYKKASQIRYSGFIAQEVEEVAKSIQYNFSGISKPENTTGHYGLDYASFVVPLVKAVQELNAENNQLKLEVEQQKINYQKLEERIRKLE